MELKVNEYTLPAAVSFNYDELKAALTEKVHVYETMVYGDDQIKQAKGDRAELNKLDKALNDERIRLEKEYMVPFNTFKGQIDELRAIIKKAAATSDKAVKDYEERKKQEKAEEIKQLFAGMGMPDYITLEKVWRPEWLNATVTMAKIKVAFEDIIAKDVKAHEALATLPEYSFEATEFYKRNLDIAGALTEASKLAAIAKAKKEAEDRARAEAEAAAAKAAAEAQVTPEEDEQQQTFTDTASFDSYTQETVKQEPKQWIKFQANVTATQAKELRDFFVIRNIEFKPV